MRERQSPRHPLSVRIVTGVTLVSIFIYSFSVSLTNVIINEVVDGFSLSGAGEGMMSSMVSLGSILALLAIPLIQGRVPKMTMILLAMTAQAGALALSGLAGAFPLFCAFCMMRGVGGGVLDTYANSTLTGIYKEGSARYLSYLHGLFGLGSLIAPLLIQRLMRGVGWRGVFLVLSAVFAAGAGALFLLGRRGKLAGAEQFTGETVLARRDLSEYIKNPRNIAVLLGAVFSTATETGILVWVMRYMTLRFDEETLGAVSISVFWACATVSRFSMSRVRVPQIRLFIAGALLTALCLGAGVLSGSAWGMTVAMGGMGFCSGHFMQVLFSECARGYEGKTTFVTSVLMIVMDIARTLIPLIIASVSASLSVSAGMLIPAVMAVAAAAAGVFIGRLPPRTGPAGSDIAGT